MTSRIYRILLVVASGIALGYWIYYWIIRAQNPIVGKYSAYFQDIFDLKTVEMRGNKTEIFKNWQKCAKERLVGKVGPDEFYPKFTDYVRKCDEEADVDQMGIITIFNNDEGKVVILPKNNDPKHTLVTIGIGRDTLAEIKFRRKMQKLNHSVQFYGADPIVDVNSELYSQLGKYFPFAVSQKAGYSKASVLKTDRYEDLNVVHVDISYFLNEILRLKQIDNLWIDAEFAEYELFEIFHKNGTFDRNGIEVCQINMEVHYTSTLEENSERRQKFQNFVEKIVTDGKYAIFHAAQLLHQRLYLFNFESQFCRDKY